MRIIYTNESGGVSVVIPAPEALETMTIEEIAAKSVPAGVPFEIVSADSIPAERTFRNAWVRAGKAVKHDLPKCRAVAHDKRRAARAREFAPLDIEATIPAKAAQAEAKRQAVRDRYDAIQTQIDAAASIEALLAIVKPLNA